MDWLAKDEELTEQEINNVYNVYNYQSTSLFIKILSIKCVVSII